MNLRVVVSRLAFECENATHWLADHRLMPKRLQRWICDRYEYSIWVNGGCEIGGIQMADFYTEAERAEIWRKVRREVGAAFDAQAEAGSIFDAADGAALFDARCRQLLDIPGAEFIANYDAGTAWDLYDHNAVSELSTLVPFTR